MSIKKIISACTAIAFSVSLTICSAESASAIAVNIPCERISETQGIGLLQGVYNVDIDNDNEKEQIALYKNISDNHPYIATTFCEVYDNGSSELLDTFFTVAGDSEFFRSHIIYDGNTDETFVGFEHVKWDSVDIYKFGSDEPVAAKARNGKDGMIEDEYNAYMEKVVFLDEVVYDKPNYIPREKIITVYSHNDYTAFLKCVINADIDNDDKEETIAFYSSNATNATDLLDNFCDVYDESSVPQTFYKKRDVHYHNYMHIIQDNNTGRTFLGYYYCDSNGTKAIYEIVPDGKEQLVKIYDGDGGATLKEEECNAYMEKVVFLDEVYSLAYSKGDADGNADITLNDAIYILSCYSKNAAGLENEMNNIEKQATDVDSDGKITISDAIAVLSVYAEHAAGLIDTVLLPNNVAKDEILDGDVGNTYLANGTLASVFYYDIDNDGRKETIGRYTNNKVTGTNNGISECSYQVYDNGALSQSFIGINGMVYDNYFLINDKNINQTYVAHLFYRCTAMYGYAGITSSYPLAPKDQQDILYLDKSYGTESDASISINGKSATKQEFLDYIDNLEIISPYKDEAEDLTIFEYIFDTYYDK